MNEAKKEPTISEMKELYPKGRHKIMEQVISVRCPDCGLFQKSTLVWNTTTLFPVLKFTCRRAFCSYTTKRESAGKL